MNTYRPYFQISLIVLISLFVHFFSWIQGVFSLLLSFIIYSCLAYVCVYIWKKMRVKEKPKFPAFILYFSSRISFIIWVSSLIIFCFCYYHNTLFPASIPSYHISNGKQNIYFQANIKLGHAVIIATPPTGIINLKVESLPLTAW